METLKKLASLLTDPVPSSNVFTIQNFNTPSKVTLFLTTSDLCPMPTHYDRRPWPSSFERTSPRPRTNRRKMQRASRRRNR